MTLRPQNANVVIPGAGPEYNRSNEEAVRRQLTIVFETIQRRLTSVESIVYDQQPAIADPAGGGTVDAQARTAIIAILDVLRELTFIEP